MRVEIDQELEDIFPAYLESRRTEMTSFRSYLSSEDFESMRQLAHKIAGNAGAYGLKKLGELSRELEKAASSLQKDACIQLVEEMASYLSEVEPVFISYDD